MKQLLDLWSGQTGLAGTAGNLTFLAIVVWSFVWKGLALWRAAHKESRWWFVILLVVNTLGILEIFYLFFFSKRARAGGSPFDIHKKDGAGDDGSASQGGKLHG